MSYSDEVDLADTVIEISSRGAEPKGGETGNVCELVRKNACNDGLPYSNSYGTSNGTDNVECIIQLDTMTFTGLPKKHKGT